MTAPSQGPVSAIDFFVFHAIFAFTRSLPIKDDDLDATADTEDEEVAA